MDTLTKLISITNNKAEAAYHNLAEQMLRRVAEIPRMSIYELADACYTSTTAISRFVRRLEYENFHQFKSALAGTLNYYPQYNRKMPLLPPEGGNYLSQYTGLLCEQLRGLAQRLPPEQVDAFVGKIAAARQIIFVSPAPFGFPALQYDLAISGRRTLFSDNLTDSLRDLEQAGEKTFALFFISPERESSRTESLLRLAKEKGAALGAVARGVFRLPRRYTGLTLSYESTGTDMDDMLFLTLMNLLVLRFRFLYVDGPESPAP